MSFTVSPTATQRQISDLGIAALALGRFAQKIGPIFGPATSAAALDELSALASGVLAALEKIRADSSPVMLSASAGSPIGPSVKNTAPRDSLHNNEITRRTMESMQKA